MIAAFHPLSYNYCRSRARQWARLLTLDIELNEENWQPHIPMVTGTRSDTYAYIRIHGERHCCCGAIDVYGVHAGSLGL